MKYYPIAFLVLIFFAACEMTPKKTSLPYLGNKKVVNGDTIYHTIPDFEFVNQDGEKVTPETFKGEAYIVDYFFTSCPTICPVVKGQTLKIYEHFKDNSELNFLSVSFDTKYDTIPRLRWYADKLEVDGDNWHFVTGDKDLIYDIATDFFHVAMEDAEAPGGFNHDGNLVLVDRNKNVRGFCDGTDPESVDAFLEDIELLFELQKTADAK